jgi:hypothetical protein
MSNYAKKLNGKNTSKTTINSKASNSPVETKTPSLDELAKLFDLRAAQPIQATMSLPEGEYKVKFISADKLIIQDKLYATINLEYEGAKLYPVKYVIPQAMDIFFTDLSRIMLQWDIKTASNMQELNQHKGQEITIWVVPASDPTYTNTRFHATKAKATEETL